MLSSIHLWLISSEAGFYVALKYPGGRFSVGQYRKALLDGIGAAPVGSKSVRVWVGDGFCDRIQGHLIQRLHCTVVHCRNAQWSFRPFFLGM